MDTKRKQELRWMLEQQLAETETAQRTARNELPVRDGGTIGGLLDDALRAPLVEETTRRLNQASARLATIKQTLRDLEYGTYGSCKRCGKNIDTIRLKALPTARQCINCQRAAEAV